MATGERKYIPASALRKMRHDMVDEGFISESQFLVYLINNHNNGKKFDILDAF